MAVDVKFSQVWKDSITHFHQSHDQMTTVYDHMIDL